MSAPASILGCMSTTTDCIGWGGFGEATLTVVIAGTLCASSGKETEVDRGGGGGGTFLLTIVVEAMGGEGQTDVTG